MNFLSNFRYYKKLFAIGALSLAVQIASIRELLIVLSGNEIIIGSFYSSWLFAVVIGAKLSLNFRKKYTNFLLYLYPLIALLTYFVFSQARAILGANAWEEISLIKSMVLTLFANLPFGILGGILFVKLINIAKEKCKHNALSYGYTFESLGSVCCGILTTLLLLFHIPSVYILLTVGLLFYFLNSKKQKGILTLLSLTIYICSSAFLIYKAERNYDYKINTPFQELALKDRYSDLLLFSNSKVIASYPNRYNPDALAALIMSQSKTKAKRILISGLAQEELINSLSLYNLDIYYHVKDKDYVKHIYPKIKARINLNDQQTTIINKDLRNYLMNKKEYFDAIIIAQSGPSILSSNSYYSDEFFRLCKSTLSDNGILLVPLEQELNFLDKELALYGSSILMTLDKNFKFTTILPGKIHYFLATNTKNNISTDPETIIERYKKLKPQDSIYQAESFYSIFDRRRIDQLHEVYRNPVLLNKEELINYDNKPSSYILNNIVSMRKNNIQSASVVAILKTNALTIIAALFLILVVLRFIYLSNSPASKSEKIKGNTLIFQALSGFTSLSTYLLLIYFFQIKFAQLYSYLGLLSAAYMFGLCLGAIICKKICYNHDTRKALIALIGIQIIYLSSLILLTSLTAGVFTIIVYIAALAIAGFVGGCSYPLAESIINKASDETTKYLEEYDYIGACLSGISVTLFFMPFIGFKLFIFFLIVSWLILALICTLTWHLKPSSKTVHENKLEWIILFIILSIFAINIISKEPKQVTKASSTASESTQYIETKDINGSDKILGYGGPLNLALNLDNNQVIQSIELKENNETPYYVQNIDTLLNKYIGISLCDSGKLVEVDAISGATITSNAVLENLVNVAAQAKQCSKPKVVQKTNFANYKSIMLIAVFLLLSIVAKPLLRKSLVRTVYLAVVAITLGIYFQIQFSSADIVKLINLDRFRFDFAIGIVFITLLFGRLYCAYLCPFGALSELASKLSKYRFKFKNNNLFKLKYLFLITIIVAAIFSQMKHFDEVLTVFFSGKIDLIYCVAIVSLIISIFIPRFWCKYFCPSGALISCLSKLSIRIDKLICPCSSNKTIKHHYKQLKFIPSKHNYIASIAVIIISIVLIYSNYNNQPSETLPKQEVTIAVNPQVVKTEAKKQTKAPKATPGLKTAPIVGIKFIIDKGHLSDHESMYYDKIDLSE